MGKSGTYQQYKKEQAEKENQDYADPNQEDRIKEAIIPASLLQETMDQHDEEGGRGKKTLKVFEREHWITLYQFLEQYVGLCRETIDLYHYHEDEDRKKKVTTFMDMYHPSSLTFCLVTYINNYEVWEQNAKQSLLEGQMAEDDSVPEGGAEEKKMPKFTKGKNESLRLRE